MMDERGILTKVHQLRSATAKTFQEKWDAAKENARFYRMLQWSDTQLQKFTSDKRVPYVLDYTSSVMNTYLGVQRDERTDIVYISPTHDLSNQGNSNEVRVELLNTIKDSVLRQNDFLFLESDVFQGGIIEKAGFIGYEWTTERNPLGELKMFTIPQREMSWDLNRRTYSLHDSQWVSRTRIYDKKKLAKMRPDFAKEIMRLQMNSSFFDQLWLDETYFKQIVYFDLDAVALIEFYEKDYKDKFYIFNPQTESFSEDFFDTKQEAASAIRKAYAKMEAMFTSQGIQPPERPNLSVKNQPRMIIKKSELIHDMVITGEEETDYQKFPYDAYYPYWHDGEWWSVLDTFKDAQKFINKTFAMVDHQMMTGSKGLLLIDDTVPESKAKEVVDMFSKTGGAIRVKGAKENFQFLPPTGFDPRLLTAMDTAVINMEKKAGGGNFLGHKESSGESGLAIEKRVQQGSLSSFVVYDNLSRWKKSVGEQIAWFVTQFMTASQKMRIEGEELTTFAQQHFPQWFEQSKIRKNIGFVTINTEKNNTLEGLKVDVIVDEAKHSTSKNQRVLAQIGGLMQSSPILAETVSPEMIIDLLDIPASVKIKWEQQTQQLMQAKMAKDQAEMQKPPSISATLKDIEGLDPQAQAQFIQKYFGINISAPMQKEDNSVKEIADLHLAQQDMNLKRQKHDDQTNLKILGMLNDRDIEQMKLENKKNGEANLQTT